MPKKSWGTKRTCPSCGAKFYDLRKNPIECPKCEHTFEPEAPKRAPREPAAAVAAAPAPEKAKASDEILAQAKESDSNSDDSIDVGLDVDIDDDDDEQEDKGVLEDTSDIVGDDDVPKVSEQASEGTPDDR